MKRGPQDVRTFLEALNVVREDNVNFGALPEGLKAGYDRYEELLDQHRYLDYSRIMVEAIAALHDKDDPGRLRLQGTLASIAKSLIVDEYQDVNPLQESLIWRMHELGANVCVVGELPMKKPSGLRIGSWPFKAPLLWTSRQFVARAQLG